jgi:hypothetical protein
MPKARKMVPLMATDSVSASQKMKPSAAAVMPLARTVVP